MPAYRGSFMLKEIARSVWSNAYAPYSKFKVGVAIKTIDGSIFSGVNVKMLHIRKGHVRKQQLLQRCVLLVKGK